MTYLTNSHWRYLRYAGDINERLGFVYCITNQEDGRRYLGRKQFWNRTKNQWFESDWRFYTGSSRELSKEIDQCGTEHLDFEIVSIFDSKTGISLGEATLILCSGSLLEPERFYNRAAPSVRGRLRLPDSDREEIWEIKNWIDMNISKRRKYIT